MFFCTGVSRKNVLLICTYMSRVRGSEVQVEDPPLNRTQGWIMHPRSSKAVHSLAWSLGVTQQIRRFCSQGEMETLWGTGVGELQNKYSCKGEINWKIKRNVNENSLKVPLIYMVSKCLSTDRFLNTAKMALQYALICSAWKLSFNLLQLH